MEYDVDYTSAANLNILIASWIIIYYDVLLNYSKFQIHTVVFDHSEKVKNKNP